MSARPQGPKEGSVRANDEGHRGDAARSFGRADRVGTEPRTPERRPLRRRPLRWPAGLRWWELLPEAVLALGLGFFFATEMSAAISAFKSRTAIMLMLAVAVG